MTLASAVAPGQQEAMLGHVKTITSKLNRALLPICCVMIGCCYLDRSNVAYMQLQLRRPPPAGMGFSSSLYGNASGLFFLGYSICQVPSNMILVRQFIVPRKSGSAVTADACQSSQTASLCPSQRLHLPFV